MTWRVVGIDPSLRGTGVVSLVGDAWTHRLIRPQNKGVPRIVEIRDTLLAEVDLVRPHLAVIEGYSYGSRGRSLFDLGELGGVLRVALVERPTRVLEVPPSVLKKYATGRGNAGKPDMLIAAYRRWQCRETNDNIVDALALAHLGRDYLSGAFESSTQVRLIHDFDA